MPIVINNFKVRGFEQHYVPYMKVIPTHIPIACGVVDPNIYWFLKGYGLSHGPIVYVQWGVYRRDIQDFWGEI